MRGKFSWKITAIALLFVALLAMPLVYVDAASQATRDRLAYLQRQRDEAGHEVSMQQNLLEGTYAEMSGIMAQIKALDMQMLDALETLDIITDAIRGTETDIIGGEADLTAAQADWEAQDEIFRRRLRAMYEAGPVAHIAILFQAESFADFFMRLEYVTAIYTADRNALARMEAAENRVSSSLNQLNREHMLLLDLERLENEAINDLQRLLDERAVWFYSLAEDAAIQAELLAILEEEAHAIQVELGLAQARYRAEIAEADRIRREQERIQREAVRAAELAELNNFDGQFAWPIPSRGFNYISSPYGTRINPITNRQEHHCGIDVRAPAGTPIVAAADGIVRTAGWSGGWGITVIIDHGNGYTTQYSHNSQNRVVVGQRVTRGEHIADVGTTGHSTGNHLHFTIRRNGASRDPMQYFR